MKKIKLLLQLALITLTPVVLIGCSVENEYKVPNAYLTIDINPSIEIITDEEGLVSTVTPLNEDAEALLVDVDFTGMAVDEATNQIVQLAIEMGYLDFDSENAIIITAEAGEATDEFTKTLAEKVEAFVAKRKMNIEVLKANFEATPDMEALADELNISIGKLKLITVAMLNDPELTIEAAAQMSIKDLNRIIIDARKEVREFYKVEFHDQFQQLKDELFLIYLKEKTTLLNNVIQNADANAFISLNLTIEQVTAVKAIYQAYADELLNLELETVEDSSNHIDKIIEEINKQRENIKERISEELHNIKNNRSLSKEEREIVQERIKKFRDYLADIEKEIVDNLKEYIKKNHRKVWQPLKPIKDLQRKYHEILKEYDINIHDIEELFIEVITNEINNLHKQYKESLAGYREDFITQAAKIKQQLIEEKLALKDLWRNHK